MRNEEKIEEWKRGKENVGITRMYALKFIDEFLLLRLVENVRLYVIHYLYIIYIKIKKLPRSRMLKWRFFTTW